MKTSTEIWSIAKHSGYEKAVEYAAKAGFDAFDFSMFDMACIDWEKNILFFPDNSFSASECIKFARRLKQIGKGNGIVCNQSHAPFPSNVPGMAEYLKRSIECTAEAGGEICVIHPINIYSAEQNAEFYAPILDFAKDYKVKIAAENMFNWDSENNHALPAACSSPQDFLKNLEAADNPNLVACLDIGHAELKGVETSSKEMILTLGNHLQALHIHDNDLWHDSHQLPFSMQIDYNPIFKALKKVNYSGWFTLEADSYLSDFSQDNVFKGVCDLAAAAKKFEQSVLEA